VNRFFPPDPARVTVGPEAPGAGDAPGDLTTVGNQDAPHVDGPLPSKTS